MILSKRFINNKIRTLSRAAASRAHCYRSFDDVRYVLLLCEARDWNMVSPCINLMKERGKTVHVCVYIQKQDETPIWDYAYLLVEADSDVDFWGFPRKNVRNQLNGLSVDILIDFTGREQVVMRYLALQHPAAFKVGAKYASDGDMYDLSIVMKDEVHDIPFLFKQILNYLQIIRSRQ
ncbi:MAG: hypothetical protein LBK07_07725 [Tannerella sp.]|jgi:hypothetical protein|nr:hypothetical protein [Tannerella sp.]